MKAILVPNITNLNKGDQALAWESCRLIDDLKLFDDLKVLTEENVEKEQMYSIGIGYNLINGILKHPRRGKHSNKESTKDAFTTLIRLVFNAIYDFISRYFLLIICKRPLLTKLFFSPRINSTIIQFRECNTVFVKGGGFIHAYGEKTAPYIIWFFLFYIRLALRLHKKVVILPNSFGPFKGITVKKQIKTTLSKVHIIYARELISSFSIGEVLNKKISVQPDLGFFLKSYNQEKSLSLLKRYGLSKRDKIIGITIRPWRFPDSDNKNDMYENYINSMTILVNYLLELNYKVVFCNQSIGPNAHEDDRNAIQSIYNIIQHDNLIWINEDLRCDELKSLYSNFYFFVGTRFHSVIFALSSLVPSIAIGYGGNKAKGIMQDISLEKYILTINEITPYQIIQLFNDAINNYDNIKFILKSQIEQIFISRTKMLNEIKMKLI